ncbi:M48 family metalloprotease [Kitasatospora sp. NBC_01287]|uniref:M48 family metalloprotease n=1 Tax=Kitasatospora sp. NBC_01287 TaxID=2903573 RepID=UPI002257732D|nr:M48 family metalloprotease [Kitasatospora sp. NBC_01287]MCX4745554.1 M48 family metalloprotease [Kitasatospora sp. NBC_01287]
MAADDAGAAGAAGTSASAAGAGTGTGGSGTGTGGTGTGGSGGARGGADFTPEELARGRALRRAQVPWLLGGQLAGLVVTLLLGLTPAGAHLVHWAGDLFGGSWAAQVLGGTLALVLIGQLVGLPSGARVRVVRARFGLVTQGWAGWAVDQLRGLALGLVLALPLALGVYALIGWSTRWWWAPAAGAAALLTVVFSFLFPLLVEPLFNRFTPLADGELRTALLALAERDGVRVREVLVADASRRTTALNAYVSGFGATRRIVAYDTLLSTAEQREVELVVAHELGHVVHRDVPRGTALGALGAAVAVAVLGLLAALPALRSAAGVPDLADPRSLPLLAALAAVLGALAGPPQAAVSRRIEAAADRHALELTADPEQFIAMQRRLAVANVADVDPPRALELLFATHPSTARRIAAARRWTASADGRARATG